MNQPPRLGPPGSFNPGSNKTPAQVYSPIPNNYSMLSSSPNPIMKPPSNGPPPYFGHSNAPTKPTIVPNAIINPPQRPPPMMQAFGQNPPTNKPTLPAVLNGNPPQIQNNGIGSNSSSRQHSPSPSVNHFDTHIRTSSAMDSFSSSNGFGGNSKAEAPHNGQSVTPTMHVNGANHLRASPHPVSTVPISKPPTVGFGTPQPPSIPGVTPSIMVQTPSNSAQVFNFNTPLMTSANGPPTGPITQTPTYFPKTPIAPTVPPQVRPLQTGYPGQGGPQPIFRPTPNFSLPPTSQIPLSAHMRPPLTMGGAAQSPAGSFAPVGIPPFNSMVPSIPPPRFRPPTTTPTFQRPPQSTFGPPPTSGTARPHTNCAITSQPNALGAPNRFMAQPNKPTFNQMSQQFGGLSVAQDGWNKGWGTTPLDLLQNRVILPPEPLAPPKAMLLQENLENCSPDIFRCTLAKVPETNSILQKARLPFGVLIHPYRDLEQLPVVSCNTIVRCRSCRTYINPFIVFKSDRRWECNLCFKVNELPEEFSFDPMSRTYGDPSRRPEVKESTIEFIAPGEYMLRPPQPACYLYVLDVSRQAVQSGYLHVVCNEILENLRDIPGDGRTHIGFITYSSTIQFYLLGEEQTSPCMLDVGSIDDIFLPTPQDLLVNLEESRGLVEELLTTLPHTHSNTTKTETCLGAALQAAYKLMGHIGGRITLMAATLPTLGPGSLKPREDPNQRSAKDIPNLGPATDFYKKFALDCSGQQIAVDLFTFNSHYIDLASLSGVSKFSGGCVYHFPNFCVAKNSTSLQHLKSTLKRYLSRKIGFEAVMRIRATRGLAVTNFHGNFFVRSTDLLSLPNVNPDAGYAMQIAVEEPLHNMRYVSFQAALLYTTSKGERRIRVHTMCLPVTANVHEVITSADQQAVVAFIAKMAVDRCLMAQMSDAREAVINACCDALAAFKSSQCISSAGLQAPPALHLIPLYCLGLLKSVALRQGVCTKLDDRVFAMCEIKTMPIDQLIRTIYPDLFAIHNLTPKDALSHDDLVIPQPRRLHLSAEFMERSGAYLMDCGDVMLIYVRAHVQPTWISDVIGVPNFAAIPQPLCEDPVPAFDNPTSQLLRNFLSYRQKDRPSPVPVFVIREDNADRLNFMQRLVDDRSEGSQSYIEFLHYVKSQIK